MKTLFSKSGIIAITYFTMLLISCEKFVDVDVPDHMIVSESVFGDDQSAMSAMQGVYNQLFRADFSSGGGRSVTLLSGLSSDDFKITTSSKEYLEYHGNQILIANSYNQVLWSSMYNVVYMANSILEGVSNSRTLSGAVQQRLVGEAKFVRAFCYFYLVNLYGKVPLILRTDYKVNSLASGSDIETIYGQIVLDLNDAIELLEVGYADGERTHANKFVAKALLARVHLFQGNWENAKTLSSEIIAQTSTFGILDDLDKVFLANSKEAIWQISPLGRGTSLTHTEEGNIFIKTSLTNTAIGLSDNLMDSWEVGDRRHTNWVGRFDGSGPDETYYYPFKYKVRYDNSGGDITEYSMVLRLAEQYLIRAEANIKLGNLRAAIADLDVLRQRAGISLLADTSPNLNASDLMEIVLKERRKELFAEWGHRWLDLKRNGIATEVLGETKDNWDPTAVLYPIPEDERLKNPNLDQNTGY
ncbi:MAG: RagB/SusD family nutrient uptake outer membrane protein [Arenibacter algicola]